jgi:hypothetical protein
MTKNGVDGLAASVGAGAAGLDAPAADGGGEAAVSVVLPCGDGEVAVADAFLDLLVTAWRWARSVAISATSAGTGVS